MSSGTGRMSRRGVLATGAAGAALATGACAAAPPSDVSATAFVFDPRWPDSIGLAAAHAKWQAEGIVADEEGSRRLGLAVRYRTDPERIRPFLTSPLEVDPSGEVQINYFLILSAPGRATVLGPGPIYGECDMMVSCLYQGHRAMTALPWILDQDFGRYAGRESVMIRKKDGLVFLDIRDGVVHAEAVRRGKTMMKISAPISTQPAHPRFWFREVGWGELRHDYRLNVDWRQELFDEGPVELWKHFGADDGHPTGMPADDMLARAPRALDPGSIRLDLGDPSPLDPYAELPILEILGGSVSLGPTLWPNIPVPRGPGQIPGRRNREDDERVNLGPVDKKALEPLAFISKAWDPPIFRGKAMAASGWPTRPGAIAVPKAALEAYRSRDAIEIGPADTIELDLVLDTALHQRVVPPAFEPGTRPKLKLIANRVEVSDVSTTAFSEVWLLAACRSEGADVWLALSHIVSLGGDVLSGREVWGYPTKLGDVSIERRASSWAVFCRRMHRDVLSLDLPMASARASASESADLTIIGAQIQPKDRKPRHKWVSNPWSVARTEVKVIDPRTVKLAFPKEAAPGLIGLSDPWFEFAGATIERVKVSRGLVRRRPARILGPVEPNSAFFVVDRGDGYRAPPAKPVTTFLVRA